MKARRKLRRRRARPFPLGLFKRPPKSNKAFVCGAISGFSLSYRDLEELMAERKLKVDHVTIWRWVQRYAPELDRRCRRELRMTKRSSRADETYLRVAGKWTYCIERR